MAVRTRSQKKYQQHLQRREEEPEQEITFNSDESPPSLPPCSSGKGRRNHRVKISTQSFLEASTRTYKVYSPTNKQASPVCHRTINTNEDIDTDNISAAEILVTIQNDLLSKPELQPNIEHQHTCLNPMSPVSVYIYRIGIYNISQTLHYKTAYILYDKTQQLYHVYSIISNQSKVRQAADEDANSVENENENENENQHTRTEFILPLPRNTIQLKYKSYINDTVAEFIMTLIVPSNEHDYYIQDDIIGLVVQPNELQEKAFSEDSCYYDIDDIVYDDTSSETTNGFKAFMIVPSRHFWYSPNGAYHYPLTEANTPAYRDNKYTCQTLNSVLSILSQSC